MIYNCSTFNFNVRCALGFRELRQCCTGFPTIGDNLYGGYITINTEKNSSLDSSNCIHVTVQM
jgi:hypothetical protein